MELAIFAKKRTGKDGKGFYSYLSTLTKKTGEKLLLDGDDLYQNQIRRLRLILEEAKELGEIDDDKKIKKNKKRFDNDTEFVRQCVDR